MKLLLDENLSPGLVDQLAVGYPFRDRSSTFGTPPKVVWLTVGNAGTSSIYIDDPQEALLVLSLPQSEDV